MALPQERSGSVATAEPTPQLVLTGVTGTDAGQAAAPGPRARLVDVSVTFKRRGVPLRAVRGVNLEVGPGEILAVVGESGSGKSVLGLTMLGLLGGDPAPKVSGRAEVCGVDMIGASAEDRRAVRRPIWVRCSKTR
jgi:peptide/nickel transport system ATP-binding protein